jgi:SNF2 family DNA or RNA helicase
VALFLPTDDGLRLQLRIQPIKQSPNLLRVGEGGKSLSMTIGGRRVRIERDLNAEINNQKRLTEECRAFSKLKALPAGDWLIENKEIYLDLLYQLQGFEDFVAIQWTEKQQLKIEKKAVEYSQFKSITINRTNNNWFQIDGDIMINDQIKMSLRDLLEKERVGRFIPLESGAFVALSDEVLTLIDHLSEVSESSSTGIRFMESFASPVISALGNLNEITQSDRYWKSIRTQLKSMDQSNEIPVPSGLKTELRDYQYEGFKWLFVNAQLRLGVCLADDMGLGKTVQSLALLLSRAKYGPSLVIAPTSVVHNWMSQAAKYAPELNMIRFGGNRANRIKQIEDLGIRDVVVCTYGLLKYEIDLIGQPNWSNVILDEAQNIKNHTTKSAQAALKLKADFRFATTGTPIENNLNELWSLFQFLNPAILKSHKVFRDRYANPIEKSNDLDARQKLNRLISPFILRRTKENVLKDLPPITEITLSVHLSDKERQVYEGLKSERMEEIQNMLAMGDQKARMKLFALLTQLRQICCNSRLVLPDMDIQSAKLNAFEGLVRRLIENGHKVLVFSQFVRHLDILKRSLETMNISYQYLVGETSTNERQQRVEAFQQGIGDVFLISLKAGGVGINLTAADYVIHMDPWWNPAVEDQASDRAHRIGQDKPVTVYRLVAKDTIEEQIVALHQSKKDLADAILEGSERSTLINADQIFDMLKEETHRYQDHYVEEAMETEDEAEVY